MLAATNQDLAEAVDRGDFRKDLYYRLNTFALRVPTLREREGDIDLLAVHFIRRHAARLGRDAPEVDPAVFARLREHPFPSNVRELENIVERAVIFCESALLEERHLPETIRRGPADRASVEPLPEDRDHPSNTDSAPDGEWVLPAGENGLPGLRELGDWYLRRVLDRVGGNKRRAAEILGIARRTLYRRLETLQEDSDRTVGWASVRAAGPSQSPSLIRQCLLICTPSP